MSKETYNLPMTLAAAMATERSQLLELVSSEDFKSEDIKRLLGDLLEDRRASLIQLGHLKNNVKQALGQMNSLVRQIDAAIAAISGEPVMEEEDDEE